MRLRQPGADGFVRWVAKLYASRHVYYHLSLPESDRLRLVVNMFAKLNLLWVVATSDSHPTDVAQLMRRKQKRDLCFCPSWQMAHSR